MPDPIEMPWCGECDTIVHHPVPIYECGICGQRSDQRRCDSCNRFSARDREGDGCPDCFGTVVTMQVIEDHDGEMTPLSDYDPDGDSYAARAQAKDDERKQKIDLEAKAKEELIRSNSVATLAINLKPGSVILVDWESNIRGYEAEVLQVARGPKSTAILTVTHYNSVWTLSLPRTDKVYVSAEPTEDYQAAESYRWEPEPVKGWIARSDKIVASVDRVNVEGSEIMMASVFSVIGNRYTAIGAFHTKEDALTAASVWRAAATVLSDAIDASIIPVTPEIKSVFIVDTPTLRGVARIIEDESNEDEDVIGIEFKSSSYPASISDPGAIVGAASWLESIAGSLIPMAHSR